MRYVFASIFRWLATLFHFFSLVSKAIFTLIVVSGILIFRIIKLSAIAPLAGVLSALFWGWAAIVPIPKNFPVIVVTGGGLDGGLGGPLGGGKVGVGSSPNLTLLADQLAWQSQLNKYAAIFAALAAVSQSLRFKVRWRWWLRD
jgi:hypothetical protein